MDEKNINGCLGTGATEEDRLLTWEMISELPELEKQDQKIFEYNQGNSPDCTIYSALGALSDLFNRELTQEQIDEAIEESFNRGRVRGQGWFTQNAVDLACDKWMEWYPDEKVAYYRIFNTNDFAIKDVIEKNYSLCTSFNGNSAYTKDRKEDGKIDNDNFWAWTRGHAVCLIGREGKKFVKDNYKGRTENGYYTNIYEVVPEISALRRNGCRQNSSYLIVKIADDKEKDVKRLNEMKNLIDKIETAINITMPLNSDMWEKTHDEEYQKQLHLVNESLRKLREMNKGKKKDIERELGKYFKE